ncbi:MAG: metallophosphoesterase [Clostridiales bacterium]|nr:metallophosphoesterase [Clostridiales bacterium]
MPRYQYKYRRPQRRKTRMGRVLLLILVLLLIGYPFFEAFHLNVQEHTTELKGLPSTLRNLKIVYLTDIHQNLWNSQNRTDGVIKAVNSLGADLVLLGGDYADDAGSAIAFFESLPLIQARLGAFGVLGNNDRNESTTDLKNLIQAMKDAGVTPLINEVASIKVGQATLYIAGIDDLETGDPDVEGVAAQVSADDFVILLGHNPDLLTDAVKAVDKDGKTHWFDLALFGHTHGGQITLFGKPLLAAFSPDTSSRYLSGWIIENRAEILVSNGVGTTIVPMRLFAPAQIHLIRLR